MAGHIYKNDVAMAYDRNKKRLRLEGRLVLDELMNEALNDMTGAFNEAAANGELLELVASRDDILGFLKGAVQRQLGDGA